MESATINKCATCAHMGRIYNRGGLEPDHTCAKSDQRRADHQKPTGDFTTDFERWWRTFFDATPGQRACRYYEERPLIGESDLAVLRQFVEGKYTATTWAEFRFLSPENAACERMSGMFTEKERSDGPVVTWATTPLGRAELVRAAIRQATGEGE